MIQRGRKSTASLAVVKALPSVMRLPEPPDDLPDEAAVTWRSVVATKPPEWFTADTLPLLAAYCRHCAEYRRLSALLDEFNYECLTEADEDALKRFDRLTKIQDRLSRSMTSLATKMRLTQQSQYGARGAARAGERAAKARPWLDGEDD